MDLDLPSAFMIAIPLLIVLVLIVRMVIIKSSPIIEVISSGCLNLLGSGGITIELPFSVDDVSICFSDSGPSSQPSCMPNLPDQASVEITEDGIDIEWSVGGVRQLSWDVVGHQ